MTGGFTGKILKVNLTTKDISTIDSSKYEAYGGGYGTATAIFWDLCVAPGDWDLQDAFDSRNIISIMTGPLAGTGVPYAGRTSVSGLSPQAYPINWFSRSNFGGQFSTMLKQAGWDGIVVQGKAPAPVWIKIVDNVVSIEDAKTLWGLNTWETQEELWRLESVTWPNPVRYGEEWQTIGAASTLQRPAIVTIGPAGENKSRVASLIHGAASGAGQGGFGGVFGSKNLKAVFVLGTGSVKVADAKAVLDARFTFEKNWPQAGMADQGKHASPSAAPAGLASCSGCARRCRNRSGIGVETQCMDTYWYNLPSKSYGGKVWARESNRSTLNKMGSDIVNKYGINAFDTAFGGAMAATIPGSTMNVTPDATGMGWYLYYLYEQGVIGPGKAIDTYPLPMESFTKIEFAEAMANALSNRIGIGDLLAEGTYRFAEKIGRLSDTETVLRFPQWGCVFHWTLPGVEWAFGSLMDSRDTNSHDIDQFGASGKGTASGITTTGVNPAGTTTTAIVTTTATAQMTCENLMKFLATEVPPYNGDPYMFSYTWQGDEAYKTGIYSDHKAKLIAWQRHYQTFWKESALLCDLVLADFYNTVSESHQGATPGCEILLYNAVTGKNMKFEDGMEMGRKAWNLKRAIMVLQGRIRSQEKFAGFMYKPGAAFTTVSGGIPMYDGTKWYWNPGTDMYLSEAGVEKFKDNFYAIEGWDSNGYPTRKTLEGLGLKSAADALAAKGKLGA